MTLQPDKMIISLAMLQAIARIYRYGQTHATFVYRLLYKGTAEHRVYRRNVDKEGLFMRVVDKQTVKGELTHFPGLSLVIRELFEVHEFGSEMWSVRE